MTTLANQIMSHKEMPYYLFNSIPAKGMLILFIGVLIALA